MTLNEYLESYGWKIEDCSAEEIREAKREMKDIKEGKIILDSILFKKSHTPFESSVF